MEVGRSKATNLDTKGAGRMTDAMVNVDSSYRAAATVAKCHAYSS